MIRSVLPDQSSASRALLQDLVPATPAGSSLVLPTVASSAYDMESEPMGDRESMESWSQTGVESGLESG